MDDQKMRVLTNLLARMKAESVIGTRESRQTANNILRTALLIVSEETPYQDVCQQLTAVWQDSRLSAIGAYKPYGMPPGYRER